MEVNTVPVDIQPNVALAVPHEYFGATLPAAGAGLAEGAVVISLVKSLHLDAKTGSLSLASEEMRSASLPRRGP